MAASCAENRRSRFRSSVYYCDGFITRHLSLGLNATIAPKNRHQSTILAGLRASYRVVMSLQPTITTVSAFSLADPWIKQAMAALLCFLLSLAGGVHAREGVPDLPMLSVSVLQFGTAHWELDHPCIGSWTGNMAIGWS